MQLSTISLFILSAGALALHTNDTPTPKEHKRGILGAGTIAAFDTTDCTGPPNGARPPDGNGDCIAFTGTTDNIGINWGNGPFIGRATGLVVYPDKNCQGQPSSRVIPAPTWDDKVGTNTCISMKANGGPWKGVKFCHEDDLSKC